MPEGAVAGIVAPTYVAQSPPDGRTLLLDYHVPPINAAVGKLDLAYFAPVAQVAI